jgi:hypothetical protein
VAIVRTDVSEDRGASIIRATRIGEPGTLAVTSVVPISQILVTLIKEVLSFSETSVLTRTTRRNFRENLKSYANGPLHRQTFHSSDTGQGS